MTPRTHLTPSSGPDSIQAASASPKGLSSLSLITPTSSPLTTLLLPDELRHLVASQWPAEIERLEKALQRLLRCNEVPLNRGLPVEVMQGYSGHPYFTNVQRCGLVYVCPLCRERILYKRAALWRRNAKEVIRRGGAVYFMTLTVPHSGRSLTAGLDLLRTLYREAFGKTGKRAISQQVPGYLGISYQTDIVHHDIQGWNPHLHCLIYVKGPLSWLATWLAQRWSAALEKLGFGECPGSATIEEPKSVDAVVNYTLKLKEPQESLSRGPIMLALAGANSDTAASALFGEYVTSVAGYPLTRAARGLTNYLRQSKEPTDEQLNALNKMGGDSLHSFSSLEWQQVVDCRQQSDVLFSFKKK